MRRWYLAIPVVAVASWFACGKLSTKRTDDNKSSAEKTATSSETETDTDTDISNPTSTNTKIGSDEDCLAISKVEDSETVTKFFDLGCPAAASICATDADCTYGGEGGCNGPIPVNAKYASLVSMVNQYRGRAADCALLNFVPKEKVTSLCQNKQCVGKATFQKKDGAPADCVFGEGTACQEAFLCSSVYFGEELVDIREYAVEDTLCTLGAKTEGTFCFQFPGGNTNPPGAATYQRMTPKAACQRFTNAASQ